LLNLEAPSSFLQTELQRSLDVVSFGLQAARQLGKVDLKIPDTFGQIIANKSLALDADGARPEFISWVLANGLRDCVEAVGPMLEWARKSCVMWSLPGAVLPLENGKFRLSGQITGEQWNSLIVVGGEKFDRMPLTDKFTHLQSDYGWRRPELTVQVLSLNAARNCLAHRRGIVGKKDLKSPTDSGMELQWVKLILKANNGSGGRVLLPGSQVQAGEVIEVSFERAGKPFALGEKIMLDSHDYLEITLTFLLFGLQVQKSTLEIQNSRMPSP
jgi:hypothetical protein